MKIRLRTLISFLALFLFLLTGCGESAQQSTAPVTTIGDDPVAEILEIFETKNRFDRVENLVAILRSVPAEQIDVIPTVLDELKLPLREFERVLLVSAWAQVDPEAATKWAMKRERIDILRSTMFSETTYLWALKDPKSVRTDMDVAMAALRGWDPIMLRGFVRGWFDSGEPELEAFIRDMGRNGDDRQRAMSELIRVKFETETPEAMIAWATAIEGEPRYRAYVYSRLAADIANENPEIAIAWCAEVCNSQVGEDMPHWIASSWVRKGGVEAMDWIISQPDSVSTSIGIRSTFRRFQLTFPEESDIWLDKYSEEERVSERFQGPVIMHVKRQANLARMDVALTWSKYIQNDWERERSLTALARTWLQIDEEAAEAWLSETTELGDATKTELLAARKAAKEKAEKRRAKREARS